MGLKKRIALSVLRNRLVKAILKWIALRVPFLGSGPMGWLIGWLVGKAFDFAISWIQRLAVDAKVNHQVKKTKEAMEEAKVIRKSKVPITKEERRRTDAKIHNALADLVDLG